MHTTRPATRTTPSRRRVVGRTIDLDPYLVDETTITLDEWRHQPSDYEQNEIVRLHQPHGAQLVA